jgi:hypothetical protein
MLYDPGDLSLPILKPCPSAHIDPSNEEPNWTGCSAREFMEAT